MAPQMALLPGGLEMRRGWQKFAGCTDHPITEYIFASGPPAVPVTFPFFLMRHYSIESFL